MKIFELLEKFIRATAWEMEKPAAYGAFHLIFTFVGLAAVIGAAYLLRRTEKKANRTVLLSVGIFLILTEVYKHLFYYYVMGNGDYPWWIFPFQLCSIPMYFCIIAPLLPEGKLQRALYSFMGSFNLLGGLMAFIEPSGIVHGHWTLTLHAFVWHMLLIFVGVYLLACGRAGSEKKDYLHSVYVFLCLCAVAFLLNVVIGKLTGEGINMFYVGPQNSPLAVFKTISERFGWYVSTALYIPAVCLGAFVVFLPMHLYRRRAKEK